MDLAAAGHASDSSHFGSGADGCGDGAVGVSRQLGYPKSDGAGDERLLELTA